MFRLTIDQFIPTLQLLQQPAFCVRDSGEILCNRAAIHLAPHGGESLTAWLADAAALWEVWDRTTVLEFSLTRSTIRLQVTAQPMEDGILCLLTAGHGELGNGSAMAAAAQILRDPLQGLSLQLDALSARLEQEDEDPDWVEPLSALNRQFYRLSRVACNLADLDRLQEQTYTPRLELLYPAQWLKAKQEELSDLVEACGRTLTIQGLSLHSAMYVDPALLERALLNLLSNALKYGKEQEPVCIRLEHTRKMVLLQVCSICRDGAAELLRGAFQRLTIRDQLPDPAWGLGLGLPLVQAIARLHGGMVTVEAGQDDRAVVSLAIPRRQPLQTAPELATAPPYDYAGGLRPSLLELSDVLPKSVFHPDAL